MPSERKVYDKTHIALSTAGLTLFCIYVQFLELIEPLSWGLVYLTNGNMQ
jgi:hypothetical protein